MKTFMFTAGWCVLSSSKNKKAAFDFANFCINKENSELFFTDVNEVPVNSKAVHGIKHLQFTPEEVEKFVVIPDWDHLSKEVDGWNKYYEKNIVQILS